MKNDYYSVALGIEKIRELKKKDYAVISHPVTDRWRILLKRYKKGTLKTLNLYNPVYDESVAMKVVSAKIAIQLKEIIVKITVKK